ncbi:nuclear protein MDM1-like isoform X2 [Lingula anatina]|uniref:Nuclear protein MDM1 n=2 Tax=Lingula anatina TaxID=7574 RepID=A0A1S3H5U0_LINAN|nr:nuclear protein MDM1-like isoform X2 [Lingula anatina]|eukprot:XP_013380841.1 nuclear protein MDM1-like isoform X2 [Lingula anatina]
MPVRFKPSSEYQRKFTWLSSPKSASFSPTKEQMAPPAGQPTSLSGGMYGIPTEPPLQRKKKPIPLTTTATTKYINGEYEPSGQRVEDEYTLIGDQTKFGQSIKYRNLKNDRRKALAKTFNVGGKRQAARLKNGTSSDEPGPAPAPKVNVDTGKPRVPPAPAIKSAPPPPPPTKFKPPPPQRPPPPKVQIDTGKKEPLRERREGMMNEFVQTDMEKGVADSGQEVPPDYAMKYRAGVPPPRPKNPKRVSEYQKEFSWKKPVESVPLLQAEQVVYNSSMDLPPYKSDNIPRTTEYNNQFKPWTDFYKPVEPKKTENGPEGGRKKHKMKRSKSEAELRLSPDKRPPAGIHQVTSPDDKRLVKESLNPQRIFFPHGKYRNYRSEYHSNFRPPWKYTYEDGAWRGANPPHIMPVKENESDPEAGQQPPPPSPGANWFAEVVELRKKAEEYRKRAQGTHFSREHLAQLLAQQAELWDQVSESSTLSALSLEQPAKKHRRKENKENEQPRESKRTAPPPRPPPPQGSEPVRRKLAWEKSEEDERASGIGSIASPEGTLTSGSMSDTEGTLGADDDDEGRIPTPRLRVEQVQRQSNVQRHHLDRTTPAVGGALLTSPPPRKRTPRKTPPQVQRSQPQSQPSRGRRSSSSTSNSTMSNQPPRKEGPPAVNGSSPTFGMPTRDSHMLIDDSVSYDRGMETKYVHSPQPSKARRDRPNSGSMHGRPMTAMPQKRQPQQPPNYPSPIPEQMGKTYAKPTLEALKAQERLGEWKKQDDDTLSTSTRSLASSCSLASEVLERARSRRDEFWGKQPGETGKENRAR